MLCIILFIRSHVIHFMSQVWWEPSNHAQVFFTAGLHGHPPALTWFVQVHLQQTYRPKSNNFFGFYIYFSEILQFLSYFYRSTFFLYLILSLVWTCSSHGSLMSTSWMKRMSNSSKIILFVEIKHIMAPQKGHLILRLTGFIVAGACFFLTTVHFLSTMWLHPVWLAHLWSCFESHHWQYMLSASASPSPRLSAFTSNGLAEPFMLISVFLCRTQLDCVLF